MGFKISAAAVLFCYVPLFSTLCAAAIVLAMENSGDPLLLDDAAAAASDLCARGASHDYLFCACFVTFGRLDRYQPTPSKSSSQSI